MTKKKGALFDISMDTESLNANGNQGGNTGIFNQQSLSESKGMTKFAVDESANIIFVMNGKVAGGR